MTSSRTAVRLAWLVLLLDPPAHALATPAMMLLAPAALLLPGFGTARAAWLLAAALAALPIAADWTAVDNHVFLRVYLCVAFASACGWRPTGEAGGRDERVGPGEGDIAARDVLAHAACALLAFVFFFATVWKAALSPDFVDGRFFRFAFATDSRFADWSALLGGLSDAQQAENRAVVRAWLDEGRAVALHEPARLRALAYTTTAWVLALEAALAIAFAARAFAPWLQGRAKHLAARIAPARDPLLFVFVATTFAVAPVEGFGMLLVALGLAQAASPFAARLYGAAFFLLLAFEYMPWVRVWRFLA